MIEAPYALLAELTHRCPLRCTYCSNPLALVPGSEELRTDEWAKVWRQASVLGVLQVQLSGGEPLARRDLEQLVAEASALGMYTHLVTSGISLGPRRVEALSRAGLRSVQLSIQGADAMTADAVAGARVHERKLRAAAEIIAAGLPLTVNVVLHRANLDELRQIVALAVEMGAHRVELANAQYYGWALLNRSALLPTTDQLGRAYLTYRALREELAGRVELVWVLSDYHERRPKACMGGWGRLSLTVAPDGTVLPCPAAPSISSLRFENVRERTLEWIWRESDSFNAFRGTAWMPDPCRSCDRRFTDYGGCRCQAFALTGDASRTDPVCELSPDRVLVDLAIDGAHRHPTGRTDPQFAIEGHRRRGRRLAPASGQSGG